MAIVINHLTRMGAPRICVAGIDPTTNEHVRPVTDGRETLGRELLESEGGPFGLGAVVDIGEARPVPSPPETEDHLFSVPAATAVGQLSAGQYLGLLEDIAHDDLEAIFGPALERRGGSYAIDEHTGEVSLGVLRPKLPPTLHVDGYGKLRMTLSDVEDPPRIVVTDIRFVEADHQTVRGDLVEAVNRRLSQETPALLMVGLARAWQAAGDDRARHWLQINGVCLLDDPLEP